MISAMLNNLETEEHRSDPAKGHIAIVPPLPDHDDETGGGGRARHDHREPSRTKPHCLWCGRAFTPRMTGGSPQRFCSTGHRQAFWIAARRWTMRAIETGLITVQCLKASQASVHAAREVFQPQEVTRA
jgi:hypothetical protein